ncbi:hypothetical protein [Amycolatopsis sp. NPDC051071]|uniref:hypothetical protein n=1 Tax=Amycolatopsis sp. NPDC051071 TaxID=3154637 RepID=UPI003421E2EF
MRLAMLDARRKHAETVDVGHVALGLMAAPGVTTNSGDAKAAFPRSRGGQATVDAGHLLIALLEGSPGLKPVEESAA